jgi:hypothetical protein
MAARGVAGLADALLSARFRDLIAGVREIAARWLPSPAAKIHVSAMSTTWRRTYERESDKHRAEI